MVALFIYNGAKNPPEFRYRDILSSINPVYFLIALVFILNDLLIGGWRNHIFARILQPGISQWVCFKANLANIFMGAVTPGQSGGGVAQMYYLYKNGLKVTDIVTISFANWISTMIFFPLSGFAAFYILKDVDSDLVDHVVKYGTGVFSTILMVVLVGLFAPQFIEAAMAGLGRIISSVHKKLGTWLVQKSTVVSQQLNDYRKSLTTLIRTRPQLMLYSFVLTIILYFNKYALAYFVVLALGFESNFWEVVAIQSLVYFLLYFAPSVVVLELQRSA